MQPVKCLHGYLIQDLHEYECIHVRAFFLMPPQEEVGMLDIFFLSSHFCKVSVAAGLVMNILQVIILPINILF